MKLQQLHESESVIYRQIRRLCDRFGHDLLRNQEATAVNINVDIVYEDLYVTKVTGFLMNLSPDTTSRKLHTLRNSGSYKRDGWAEIEKVVDDIGDLEMSIAIIHYLRPDTYSQRSDHLRIKQHLLPIDGLDQLSLEHVEMFDGKEWQFNGTIQLKELV